MNRHLMETQNLVISFDYSWFLAKNLAYAECPIMKFHYWNSSTGYLWCYVSCCGSPRSKFDFLLKILLIILSLCFKDKFTLPSNTVGVFLCDFSDNKWHTAVIIWRPFKFIFKSFWSYCACMHSKWTAAGQLVQLVMYLLSSYVYLPSLLYLATLLCSRAICQTTNITLS